MSGSRVNIPVSADATETIRQINRLRDALEAAGQTGRRFSEMDFSHPEMRKVLDDMLTIERRLEAMVRMRGATADTVRRLYSDISPGPFASGGIFGGGIQGAHVNPAVAAQQQAQILSYVSRGTSWNPIQPGLHPIQPAPPPPGQPPPRPPPPAQNAGDLMGSIMPLLSRSIPQLAIATGALAGARGLGSMVSDAVRLGGEEATGNDRLFRLLRDTTTDFGKLREEVRGTANAFGQTIQETQRLAHSYAELANATTSEEVQRGLALSLGFARGYGMDPGQVTQGFGRAAFAGQDPRRFAGILAEAIQQSGLTSRPGEVMETLLRFQERSTSQFGAGNALDYFAAAYSHLSSSNNPGLRGQNGANLLAQIDAAVQRGGAMGEASQYLTHRAFNRAGISNPYQIEFALAGGMFTGVNGEEAGEGNPTIFNAMAAEIMRAYPGNTPEQQYRRYHALGNHFGISPRAARAFFTSSGNYSGMIGQTLQDAGIPLDQVRSDAFRDIASITDPNADLGAIRSNILNRMGSNDPMRRQVQESEGEDLRRVMLQWIARNGRQETEGSRLQDSMAQLNNALTAAGSGLIPTLTDLRGGIASLTEGIGDATETFRDAYLAVFQGDRDAAARITARNRAAANRNLNDGFHAEDSIPVIGPLLQLGRRWFGGGGTSGAGARPTGWQPTAAPELSGAQRAFLDTIAGPESGGRYDVRYTPGGGAGFSDLSRHPRIYEPGPAGPSSAAGRYQIVYDTYKEQARQMGVSDFQPATQDRMAWRIADGEYRRRTGRDLATDLQNPSMRPQIEQALRQQWPTINLRRMQIPGTGGAPAATPAPTTSGGVGQQSSLSFNPLRVILENNRGDQVGEQWLGLNPATGGGEPAPWGVA